MQSYTIYFILTTFFHFFYLYLDLAQVTTHAHTRTRTKRARARMHTHEIGPARYSRFTTSIAYRPKTNNFVPHAETDTKKIN